MTVFPPLPAGTPVSCVPVLDPDFLPAILWNKSYRALAVESAGQRTLELALVRQDGTAFRWSSPLLPDAPDHAPLTLRYVERALKFLLWQKGGSRVLIAGAPELVPALAAIYGPGGAREFDSDFIGK